MFIFSSADGSFINYSFTCSRSKIIMKGITNILVAFYFVIVFSYPFIQGASFDKPCSVKYHSSVIIFNPKDWENEVSQDSQEHKQTLLIPSGQKIRLQCVEEAEMFRHIEVQNFDLECTGGILLSDKNRNLFAEDFVSCTRAIARAEREKSKPAKLVRNGICEKNATNIDVHVTNPETRKTFKLYSVCFDEKSSTTLYSQSYIDGKSHYDDLVETGASRPKFQDQNNFFPFNVDQAYKQWQEEESLTSLLGSLDIVKKYIPNQQYYFSRGHLFPRADPVYNFEKDSTFFYINAVPQWQILNAGNWERVERSVRNLATDLKSDLKVWTGTHGVLELQDTDDKSVEIWLGLESDVELENTHVNPFQKRLPVPKFIWKVIYSEIKNASIAIVQVNNPWAKITDADILCDDICDQITWLSLTVDQRHVSKKGFTICCDVNTLRKRIEIVPQVKYSEILNHQNVVETSEEEDTSEED